METFCYKFTFQSYDLNLDDTRTSIGNLWMSEYSGKALGDRHEY